MAAPAPPRLSDAEWLVRPATQAVFSALASRGFAARAVGGAVRNALLGRPVGDIDLATVGPARGGDRRRQSRRARCSAHRHRPWHHHRDRRARALRGHHAARGRGDARPPRHRRLHRRLGGRRAPPRLHDQRSLLRGRRRGVRPARRLCRSRPAPCALHRRCQGAHPRGLPAHPALLPVYGRVRGGPARRGGPRRLRGRARGSGHPVG